MSIVNLINLYKQFHTCVHDIFTYAGRQKKLSELNTDIDRLIIPHLFKSFTKTHPDLNDWNDEKWVIGMKDVHMSILSFLLHKDVTLYKVYTMGTAEKQEELLSLFKKMIQLSMMSETLEKVSSYLVKQEVDIHSIKAKQTNLILNIGNYKDPKNLANLLDLFRYKQFRDSIISKISSSLTKVDLGDFFDESGFKLEIISEFCDEYLNRKNSNSLLDLIMHYDLSGNVYIKESFDKKVKEYVTVLIKHSDLLREYMDIIDEKYNNEKKNRFKETMKIIKVSDKEDFIALSKENKNPVKISYDLNSLSDLVKKNPKEYNSRHVEVRLRSIIALVIERFIGMVSLPVEEKVSLVNGFINENITKIENIDTFSYDSNKGPTDRTKLQEIIKNEFSSIFSTEEHPELLELDGIKKDFIKTIKNIMNLDFTSVKKEEFNIFTETCNKIMEQNINFKVVIVKLLEEKNISKLFNILESFSKYNLNEEVKSSISTSCSKHISQLISFDSDSEGLEKTKKVASVLAKTLDFIVYYILHIRNKKIENQRIVKTKTISIAR